MFRTKVCEYRRKLKYKERIRSGKEYTNWCDKGKFWKPRNFVCFICSESGHETFDCKYTYDKVLARMRKYEEINRVKSELTERGETRSVTQEDGKKRFKNICLGREVIFKKFENVYFKENERIKFCEIEKCKIIAKKGVKKW